MILETIICVKYKALLRELKYKVDESVVNDGWCFVAYQIPRDGIEKVVKHVKQLFKKKGFRIRNDQLPEKEKDFTVSVLEV